MWVEESGRLKREPRLFSRTTSMTACGSELATVRGRDTLLVSTTSEINKQKEEEEKEEDEEEEEEE